MKKSDQVAGGSPAGGTGGGVRESVMGCLMLIGVVLGFLLVSIGFAYLTRG